jgi:hypothetical protein
LYVFFRNLTFECGSCSFLVLDTVGKLGKILIGMNKALGEIPVTVKLRTGVKDGRNTAHKLMPRLSTEWNAGCITVIWPIYLLRPCCSLQVIASWADKTTALYQTSGLGLHQGVCSGCTCTRSG